MQLIQRTQQTLLIQQTQQIQAKIVEEIAQKIHTKTKNKLKNILAVSL